MGVHAIIIIIITFLFTQGMPKQLQTGFHWGPACVNIKKTNEEIPFRLHNFAATKFINSADQDRKINF